MAYPVQLDDDDGSVAVNRLISLSFLRFFPESRTSHCVYVVISCKMRLFFSLIYVLMQTKSLKYVYVECLEKLM